MVFPCSPAEARAYPDPIGDIFFTPERTPHKFDSCLYLMSISLTAKIPGGEVAEWLKARPC